MAMTGLHFTGRSPFARVHLTGLVRDAEGVKMSKTKGNVLDPEDLVGEYGADAVRFTLALLDSPGRDIPLDPERMAGYRAFGNKIWNATRFALGKVGEARVLAQIGAGDSAGLALPERWILSRLAATASEVDAKLEAFRFDEACHALYHFFWSDLCDSYIEVAKPALAGEAPRPLVREVLLTVLDRALRLLHPVMPFLTEELWRKLPGHEVAGVETICLARYPAPDDFARDEAAELEMGRILEIATFVRNQRSAAGLAPRAPAKLLLDGGDSTIVASLVAAAPILKGLAAVESIDAGKGAPELARIILGGVEVAVELAARAAEPLGAEGRARAESELARIEKLFESARARVEDPVFAAKAPAKIVEGARAQLADLAEQRDRLRGLLEI
jgi:valyl-tRNA synthetase